MSDILRKFAGYFATGGNAALVDVGGFALLLRIGLPVPVAASASFLAAAVVNYLLSTRFVFGRAPSGRRFALFLGIAFLGLALNVSLTVAFMTNYALLPAVAKVLAIGISFVFNFLLNHFIVFRTQALP